MAIPLPESEGVIGKEMLQILRQICQHSWSLLLDGSLWLTAGNDWLLPAALGSCLRADLSDCSDFGVSLICLQAPATFLLMFNQIT